MALARLDRWADTIAASGPEDLFARMNERCREAADFVPAAGRASSLLRDEARWAQLPDPLQWMMYTDQAGHMIDDILVKVDRASMGVSLEVRNPLLDHRVVELAWRLPLDLKLRAGQRKWLLRRVLERYVPAKLIERPKMGFGVPLGAWLRGPLRDWAEALLDERRLRERGYLEPAAVRRVWEQHLSGWSDRRFLLWNILSFEAWLDETG
jgi:asparagine synthase (glutamine-hydrolysing)